MCSLACLCPKFVDMNSYHIFRFTIVLGCELGHLPCSHVCVIITHDKTHYKLKALAQLKHGIHMDFYQCNSCLLLRLFIHDVVVRRMISSRPQKPMSTITFLSRLNIFLPLGTECGLWLSWAALKSAFCTRAVCSGCA